MFGGRKSIIISFLAVFLAVLFCPLPTASARNFNSNPIEADEITELEYVEVATNICNFISIRDYELYLKIGRRIKCEAN